MSLKLVLLCVALCSTLSSAKLLSAACGSTCQVDSHCASNPDCPLCIGGRCGSGCAGKCATNSDCLDPNCQFCFGGSCGNSPHLKCGETCQSDAHCEQTSDCNKCVEAGKKGEGKNKICTALCDSTCQNDKDCQVNGCGHCLLGQCHKDSVQCGGGCTTDLDCNQATYCSLCKSGQCTAGCGQPCSASSDCKETSCKFCNKVNGQSICQEHQGGRKCHESCHTNTDCTGTPGACELCIPKASGGFACGSPCGTQCVDDSNCVTKGCLSCKGGYCSA